MHTPQTFTRALDTHTHAAQTLAAEIETSLQLLAPAPNLNGEQLAPPPNQSTHTSATHANYASFPLGATMKIAA